MIYCFKKLRELRLTHIFFLHYSVSLLIGSAVIAGLFLFGRGLQFYSIVVLCYMYTEPAFIMLRRMKMYEAKAEIQRSSLSLEDKIERAMYSLPLKPIPDKFFVCNAGLITANVVAFFLYIDIMLYLSSAGNHYYIAAFVLTIPMVVCASVTFGIIRELRNDE